MARKTRLALVRERPATDEEAARMAGQALDDAEAAEHPVAAPADVLAALATVRGQLAETARIASAAVDQANEQRARADAAEFQLGHAKTDADKVRETALQEVSLARDRASQTVAAVQRQAQVAERAAQAAGYAHQAAGALAALLSFLVDRAPVLLTLIGAFILARDILANPTVLQLAGLGIFGAVAVMPAVYLSVRRP